MPAFSFRFPRFRSRRSESPSPSPKPSPTGPHSPYPSPTPASSSRVSPIHGAPELAAYAASTTSDPPAAKDLTQLQNFKGHIGGDRALGNSGGVLSEVPRTITPINIIDPNSVPQLISPQDSTTRLPVRLPHLPGSSAPIQLPYPSHSPTTAVQQPFALERQSPWDKDLPPPRGQKQGIFNDAHSFTVTESKFIDNSIGNITLTNNFNNSNFMKELLKETIPGAAADSSARDPPPRCHPGTRLAILERCLYFIAHCNGTGKMRWVVGAAGVGKSAVMQSVADSPELVVVSNASVFFSINGRDDGNKAIMTLSYQFAAKSDLYRRVIEDYVTRDPSLFQSSMSVQFEKFIVQPFIRNADLHSAGRVLIIIDGLDECSDTRTQVELLRLVSNFCISYPSSPIRWLIASRPEPHITSFLSRPEVIQVYEKEEILVDSDEARADVERFIRHELTEIRKASDFLSPQWPDEQDLWKLANAAGGLFAYAHTAIRYIGDSNVGDPVSQLSDVLNVIDELPMSDIQKEEHPMALLDALYTRILAKVPPKIMINVRKLLLLLASEWDFALWKSRYGKNLIVMCNWLDMTADEAYAALNRLRSVVDFPQRYEAHAKVPKPFHKSLIDYMSRSVFFPNIKAESQQVKSQCAFRILKEAPDGINFSNVDYDFRYGTLVRNDGTSNKISIAWRADDGIDWADDDTRLSMYKLAMGEVAAGMKRGDFVFQSELCIKLLASRFDHYRYNHFPYYELRDFVFDKSRCHEFMKRGILKQIPAKALTIFRIDLVRSIKLRFHCPVTTTTAPDPWNSYCNHERMGQWDQGKEQNWMTVFDPERCTFCFEQLKSRLNTWITRHPDQAAMIMFALIRSCVEIRFVDPEDDVSEWAYWFWIAHSPEERKELESSVYS